MNESLVQWVLLRRPEYLQERLGFKLERKLGKNYTTDQGRIDFAFETKEELWMWSISVGLIKSSNLFTIEMLTLCH